MKNEKVMRLEQFFHENKKAVLGFSGGVDSTYLLYAGLRYGSDIKAYFIKTAFQPEFELQDALKAAAFLGTEITVLEMDVLAEDGITANTSERCYFCKSLLFGEIQKQAIASGIPLILDGSNASDDAGDRPGMRAAAELMVRSPLRECGITKEEIRSLSKEAGLFTWNKPAYACLATRVPVNQQITKEALHAVEEAENNLSLLGFSDFRVRIYDTAARLQFPKGQMQEAVSRREEVIKAVKPYFPVVLLDLEGR